MQTINWEDYSNSEIETKLKTIEFEYENMGHQLDGINRNYIKVNTTLNKRLYPKIFK